MPKHTEYTARVTFAHYFLDLQKSMATEGGSVSKAREWETFINHHIEEGNLTVQARNWRCPKSLEAELSKKPPLEELVHTALVMNGGPADAYALAKKVDAAPMEVGHALVRLVGLERVHVLSEDEGLSTKYSPTIGETSMQTEINAKVAQAGELLIRAAAVLGTLTREQQTVLNERTDGKIVDCLAWAIQAAAEVNAQVAASLKSHGPTGFIGQFAAP